MKLELRNYIFESVDYLIKKNLVELVNENSLFKDEYTMVLRSNGLFIKFQKYRRDFYVTCFKETVPKREINLFTLLNYINRETSVEYRSEYFREVESERECYKKQIDYLVQILSENMNEIKIFFSRSDFEKQYSNIKDFVITKNPTLFKRK